MGRSSHRRCTDLDVPPNGSRKCYQIGNAILRPLPRHRNDSARKSSKQAGSIDPLSFTSIVRYSFHSDYIISTRNCSNTCPYCIRIPFCLFRFTKGYLVSYRLGFRVVIPCISVRIPTIYSRSIPPLSSSSKDR